MTDLNSKLEDFKKNHLKKIAKSKMEWLKPFQEIYKGNREEKPEEETVQSFVQKLNRIKK